MLTLTSCATHSEPPPAEQPKPLRCDVRVSADLQKKPQQPAGATIVQPVTPEEQQATEAFLSWVAALGDWGDLMAHRAMIARNDCETHGR